MTKITFTTESPVVAEHFPVLPMKKAIPGWYKAAPNFISDGGDSLDGMVRGDQMVKTNGTIRRCVPVLDYLTSGYVIRSTVHIKARNEPGEDDEPGLIMIASDTRMVGTHGHAQCPVSTEGAKRTYVKFNNPWTIRTPRGYSCLFYQPFFDNLDPRFRLFPAIVDTDSYDKPINFPGYFLGGSEGVEIRPGDALMCAFPFKREAWVSEVKVAPRKPSLFDHFLHGAYRAVFWKGKSYK